MITYFLFVVGFILLIRSAHFLVEGASALAKRWGVSDLVIGLTIVAFGTSAPELIVNIIASIRGTGGLVLGNIIGSNISNILLILGIAAMIKPLSIAAGTVWKEIPFSLGAVLLLGYLINDTLLRNSSVALLSRADGIVLIACFVAFLFYAFYRKRVIGAENTDITKHSLPVAILMIIGGSGGLFLGGKWVIDGATLIAHSLGISQTMVGLTIIALGTSLPELVTSIVATLRRSADIAIGNVIGSNIFNILWVLGLSAAIRPINFRPILNEDLLFLATVTILVLVFLLSNKKHSFNIFRHKFYTLERQEGFILVVFYLLYIATVVIRK